MRRAVTYSRFSTDLQSDRSIEDQVALCRDWCQRNGVVVVREYADRAKTSASILGRDGLLQLLEDARARKFDVVVTEALDRISRDQEDLAHTYKRLEFAGVELRAVHDGAADAIQIGLRGITGEMFLRDLKHKVRRGLAGVVRDGRSAGGRAYGYRPVPGQPGVLQIDAAEAEVIRGIFAAYLAGAAPREIAGDLNARNIPPPRGATWNASTLNGSAARGYGILRNRIYRGEIVWNRVRMVRDPETGRRVSRVNDAADRQVAEAPQLRIVDPEMWDAAAARLSARSQTGEGWTLNRRPRRVFSGLLRCGRCGGGIAISKQRGGSVWGRCSNRVESGTCDNRTEMRIDRIERVVLDRLAALLDRPELLATYVAEYHAERCRLAADERRNRSRLETDALRARQAAERTLDLLIRGVIQGPAAEARYKDQDAAARAAEARHAEAEKADTTSPVTLHPAAARRYADAIRDLGQSLANPTATAEATTRLRQLIAAVRVTPEADGNMAVEVDGYLSGLLNPEKRRGPMVAEVRLGRSPTLPLLRVAV